MPILNESPGIPDWVDLALGSGQADTTVTFADPRFMAETPLLHRGGKPPLTGTVVIGRGGTVLAEGMGAHFQR